MLTTTRVAYSVQLSAVRVCIQNTVYTYDVGVADDGSLTVVGSGEGGGGGGVEQTV